MSDGKYSFEFSKSFGDLAKDIKRCWRGELSDATYAFLQQRSLLLLTALIAPLRAMMDPPEHRAEWFVRDMSANLMSLGFFFGIRPVVDKILTKAGVTHAPLHKILGNSTGIVAMALSQGLLTPKVSQWMEKNVFHPEGKNAKADISKAQAQPIAVEAPTQVKPLDVISPANAAPVASEVAAAATIQTTQTRNTFQRPASNLIPTTNMAPLWQPTPIMPYPTPPFRNPAFNPSAMMMNRAMYGGYGR